MAGAGKILNTIAFGVFGNKAVDTVNSITNPKAPTIAPPAIPPAPLAPTDVAGNQAARDAAEIARRRAARAPGRQSTLLTGASGLSTPAPVERQTLLGR